jgi:T4-like virus tail tube protein gp19
MPLETLTTQQMLANTYEPKRKFRWILQIDGIDAYTLKTAARPESTFEETMIDYMNAKRWISGKQTWNPIQVVMYDPIAPSAASKIMDWMRLNYEYATGRMGYATFYKKDITLKLLDPQGTVVELWDLQGAWPQNINWGELDYASSDNAEITYTLRFDGALLQY